MRVLPPELLRTLPDWRALVMRGNLSPVVVRLRMAWRRRDYRRAKRVDMRRDNRIGVVWQRPMSVPAAGPPQPPWPRPAGSGGVDTLPTGRQFGHLAHPESQPVSADERASRRSDHGSQQTPSWGSRRNAPRPLPPGNGSRPRARRPWDPPTDSEDRK